MNKMTLSINVRWYCRICWQQGLVGVTILPVENKLKEPTKEDLLTFVKVALTEKCCTSPDIRAHEEPEKKITVLRRRKEATTN